MFVCNAHGSAGCPATRPCATYVYMETITQQLPNVERCLFNRNKAAIFERMQKGGKIDG